MLTNIGNWWLALTQEALLKWTEHPALMGGLWLGVCVLLSLALALAVLAIYKGQSKL